MTEIKIEFDAATAIIKNEIPNDIQNVLSSCLKYTVKKKAYNENEPDEIVYLYDRTQKSFPSGLLSRVENILYQYNYTVLAENKISVVANYDVIYPNDTYTHQRDAVEAACSFRRGIIQMPTGSGKTRTAALIISRFPHINFLLTVPSVRLLKQTPPALQNILGEEIGMVGDNKRNWKRVTVGIIDTLNNIAASEPSILKEFQGVIVDECHSGTPTYKSVLNSMTNTDIRIAMSATAWRNVGDDLLMEGLIGPVIYRISAPSLIEKKILAGFDYYYLKVPDNKQRYYIPKTFSKNQSLKPRYDQVYKKAVVNYNQRNDLIVKCGIEFLNSSFPYTGLILVNQIDHGNALKNLFKEKGYEVDFIEGKSSSSVKDSVLEEIGNGTRKLAIASKILNEGVDIPMLGFGILAGAGSSTSEHIQRLGRFLRGNVWINGEKIYKEKAVIIDIQDEEHYYLNGQFYVRRNATNQEYKILPQELNPNDLKRILNNFTIPAAESKQLNLFETL